MDNRSSRQDPSEHKNRNQHPLKLTLFCCRYCKETFLSKDKLASHTSNHGKDEKCTCRLCGKKLSNKPNLERHIASVHCKSKPFSCPTCEKGFQEKAKLERHETTHNNYRRYKCTKCDRQFKQKEHLKTHDMSVHQKLKLFSCKICNKKFASKQIAITHVNYKHDN